MGGMHSSLGRYLANHKTGFFCGGLVLMGPVPVPALWETPLLTVEAEVEVEVGSRPSTGRVTDRSSV